MKKIYINCLIVFLAVALTISLAILKPEKNNMLPQELLNSSLNNCFSANSFFYEFNATLENKENKINYSQIQGEYENNKTHILGKALDSPIEFYKIENILYNRDPLTKKWIKQKLSPNDIDFVSETNPLNFINISDIDNISNIEILKHNGEKFYHIQFIGALNLCANLLLNDNISNLNFDMLITKDFYPYQVNIICQRENSNKILDEIHISMTFSNWNDKVKIVPPIS